jgi:GTPase Era involved in 16S rRNA processing
MESSHSISNYISICLIGCVSAGKSTILNAFFGDDYAQCKIKRTTMMPNKFIETNDPCEIDSFESINKQISDTNESIYKHTTETNTLDLKNYGGELTFHVGSMEMNIGKRIKICIYDIPGLNDARTKKTYYDYLRTNFNKFNIILFVVDIQSGLNTSDEIDILNFLADNIKEHKAKSGKNINVVTIVNKADYMQLNPDGKLEVLGEYGEMFEQTNSTVKQTFKKKGIEASSIDCISVCALDAHLYRMIKKHKDINKLSRENILRIGTNEEGSKFRCYSTEKQKEIVSRIIRNPQFVDSMIKLSGFAQIEVCLNNCIGVKGVSMVVENIVYEFSKTLELSLDDFAICLQKKIVILAKLADFCTEKYEEEMKKVVKQINTLSYQKINKITNPYQIKQIYDKDIIGVINSDPLLKTQLSKFLSLTTYPSYFTDRILLLVIGEYSTQEVTIAKLSYIELFENTGNLKIEIIDLILDAVMSNPRGIKTFTFDIYSTPGFKERIIRILEKIKNSTKFIEFLRFFLINVYSIDSAREELVSKRLFFRKYTEIPLYEFIGDLRTEKTLIDSNKQNNIYRQGITTNSAKDNLIELYYISKCRELNDVDNFMNHDKAITIDFSMMY